jgi:hypothetical protein
MADARAPCGPPKPGVVVQFGPGHRIVLLSHAQKSAERDHGIRYGQVGRMGRDSKARLSNLMGIHMALRILFREAPRGYA